jgi:hypothetical protein
VDLHVFFEHVREDHQVEHGRQDRRGDRLKAHFPETQQLLVEQGPEA